MVAVGTDGKIAVKASTSVNLIIDIQGYFTVGDGSPAPGGFEPVTNYKFVNTMDGTGMGGTIAQLSSGTTTTIAGIGSAMGVPATATALAVNVTAISRASGAGYVTLFPTGTTQPGTSLNYPGNTTTEIGTTVDLNSAGNFSLYVGTSGPIDVQITVEGYFDGRPSVNGFTTTQGTIFDSRVSPAVALAPNSLTLVQISGQAGIPAASASLVGVAMNVEAIDPGTADGYIKMWSDDQSQPSHTANIYSTTGTTSNLALIRPGATDGKIEVLNTSSDTVNVVFGAEGYFTDTTALAPIAGGSPGLSGARAGADMISKPFTDRSGVQINPINGSLLYSQSLLSLAGVGQSAGVMLRYNSLNDSRPSLSVGMLESQLYANPDQSMTYTAPDGGAYTFPIATGTGVALSYTGPNSAGTSSTLYRYSNPNGINATLVRVGAGTGAGTEYDLTFHPSQVMNVYHDNGSNITLDSTQDVTGANKITYTYSGDVLTSETDSQGRQITYAYTDANNPTQASLITDVSLGRTIALTYGGPAGAVSQVVDATGATTTFTYTSGQLTGVSTTNTGDLATHAQSMTYDSSKRLQTLTVGASTAAAATWTLALTSSTSLWTDPNGHAATYTFSPATLTVSSVTDPMGHAVGATWTAHADLATQSSSYNDTTTYATATSTYNLTQITSPTGGVGGGGSAGRTSKYTYTTAPSGGSAMYGTYYTVADYRPQTVIDGQTNTTTLTYNMWGEATALATGAGSGGAGTSHRTYQGDTASCSGKTGQLCTSTDGMGNVTTYAYDTSGNPATLTPPSPLGAETFTYDAAGRKISETDGRGNTAYTCYDNDDRITQVSYTSASCGTASGVTYTFDAAGNLTTRATAATGTTTSWTYDGQNRATQEAISGTTSGTTSATYDGAGNVLAYTDPAGTTTYAYDAANNLITLAEPGGSCPAGAVAGNTTKCTLFTYDNDNRRLKTEFPNGITNTATWDTSSRMATIVAKNASGTTSVSRTYSYLNGTADSELMHQMTDAVANNTTTNTYDLVNRLTGDTVKNTTSGVTTSTDNYTYDLDGNITQQATGGTTTDYGYNAANQMCWSATTTGTGCTTPTGGTSYTYDGDGNLLTGGTGVGTQTWTNYNQLASTTVGGAQTNTYTGTTNAQRVTAGSATLTTGLLGQVTYSSGPYVTTDYIRDPSGALIAMQTGGSSYYYTTDNIGSVLQLTNSAGAQAAAYTYNPYGATTSTTGAVATTNVYRYASGYTDPTGLIKFGARYYNPTLARFTQPDPSGQETNTYAYAGDNPITNTDPTGLDSNTQEIGGCLFGICVHIGETTDSDGNTHLDVGAGVSSDAFSADYTDTESTSDGGDSGLSVGASASAGDVTGGGDVDSDGGSTDAGVEYGTGDAEPSADLDANYEF